jgi:hypothetical protein
VLLVQRRDEMVILPAVTEVLVHHIAMDKRADCSIVSTAWRRNGDSACSYCSTDTSHCYGYMD